MPQPHATSTSTGYNMNNQPAGMPVGAPFGAGWVAPTQHPHQQQHQQQHQSNLHYQTAPYPTAHNNSAPYPSHNGGGAPYPTSAPYPHTAPYPSNQPPYPPTGGHGAPYPGSSYPHNPQQASYPPSSSSSTSSSSHYHNPHYPSIPTTHPTSYNPNHGYTPIRTSSGLESPAGNIQHCFEELAQRQGHPIQHHFVPQQQRKEVSVFAKNKIKT